MVIDFENTSHNSSYNFQNRAVAFLDVLGFREILKGFEIDYAAREGNEIPTASKAEIFISTFKNAVERLDKEKFRYYLFSDNICITSVRETTALDLQDLLQTIIRLFYEFATKGYFLRGGIDYGKFIDEPTIAVGVPLVNAYELESKKAVFPRIVLSDRLLEQFQNLSASGDKVIENNYLDLMIERSCEISYLNVFVHVFQSDDEHEKQLFFSSFREVILMNLHENGKNETVYLKYKWLAEEFNRFIEKFVNDLAFRDSEFDPIEFKDFLTYVSSQKI